MKNNRNKILPNYFGAKNGNGVYQSIINLIPKHKIYIEGFLGSGSIMQLKKPAEISIGIDIDSLIMNAWYNKPFSGKLHMFKGDFIDIMNNITDWVVLKDCFIYVDPPYMHSTRSAMDNYNFEMNDFEHFRLLDFITHLPADIAISCYDNPMYKAMLHTWNKVNFNSQTRGGKRIETIYFNYEINSLHDYSYLGKNFTDRQRIKRKINRACNKILSLPFLEQQAIISELNYRSSNFPGHLKK